MKEIKLTQGAVAIIDDDLFEEINRDKWYLGDMGYARRQYRLGETEKGKHIFEYMHRRIIGAKKGETTDHINRNKLDNRKENLRLVSRAENEFNKPVGRNNKSGYKGVCKWFVKRKDGSDLSTPWRAYYKDKNKQVHIGSFKTAKDAAIAYNQTILKVRGPFAFLNKVDK